ncbi:hypothetical protein RIF29_38407 [Crotalaria pallida]|uniref:Uncharacterized protein n=1 Tax=Crotalaria pallida TaxID=3830 RepID=A0AAN9HPP0_CROPI
MARVAASLTILLFLLFTFSRARASEIHDSFPESKPESETTKQINHEPHQQHDTVSFTVETSDPVPLTFVTFRPINRHPRLRPLPLPLSLRLGNRRCRLGRHRREIPYGNDMIVRSDAAVVDPAIREAVRQIPSNVARFRDRRVVIHSNHHEKEHEKGWFSNKIRPFLNMFRF